MVWKVFNGALRCLAHEEVYGMALEGQSRHM